MKNLKVFSSEILKNGKVRLCALAGAVITLVSAAGCSEKAEDPTNINLIPNMPTIETTVTPSATPSETPVVEDKLSADNFDEHVADIMAANSKNGLDTIESLVRSSLLLVNLDELSNEDLITLGINDMNMQEELQNLLTYISEVSTHNLHCEDKNYISLTDLAYGEVDKEMLNGLEERYLSLKEILAKEVKNPTEAAQKILEEAKEEAVIDSVQFVTDFAIGTGKVETKEGNFTRRNLSSGAGIVSEAYIQAVGEIAGESGIKGKEIADNLKTIDESTNGINYINDIYHSNRIAECANTQEKQLTK